MERFRTVRRPDFAVATAAALTTLAANFSSLVTADAPRWSSEAEHVFFIVTLPVSLLSTLVRSKDEDSIILWGVGTLLWIGGVFAEFWVLANLPRYMHAHRKQRRIALIAMCGLFAINLVWLMARWPVKPEEEPPLFFIQVPLWPLAVSGILLMLVWSPWWGHERAR